MSLYYNESPFVNGETILDAEHFNPMSEAITFSCCQVINEGMPSNIDTLFYLVSSGANVCAKFEAGGNLHDTVMSYRAEYIEDEECILFHYFYVKNPADGTFAYRIISVSRSGEWSEPYEIEYALPINQQ